jgi:MFS family permease
MIRKILSRDFVLCFFTQFIFTLATFSLIPTLPIYLLRKGASEAEIGFLIGSYAIASLVVRPLVGKQLLKRPEKYFMMLGTLIFALASLAYLLASPFWPFLLVRILHGIGYALFTTASFTLIANISPDGHKGQSLGYFILAFTISTAVAPPLGMFIINQFGFTHLFLTCLALSLSSLLITNKLTKRPVIPFQDSSDKDLFFLSRKALRPSILGFFPFFIWGALTTFFPIYAVSHGVSNPGFFFTTVAIILIFSRVFGGRILDLYSREKIIMPSIFPYIISMIILAFSKTFSMFMVVAIVYGIGPAFLIPALMAYAVERGGAPGPTMGTFNAMNDLGISLGPLIMGIVVQFTNYPVMFICLAIIGFINLNYFYFSVRKK